MPTAVFRCTAIVLATILSVASITHADDTSSELRLTPEDALETHGLSIFLFHNSHAVFGDEKMSGLEIILHDRRIATNGDVRLSSTPAQWEAIPQFKERRIQSGVPSYHLFWEVLYSRRFPGHVPSTSRRADDESG